MSTGLSSRSESPNNTKLVIDEGAYQDTIFYLWNHGYHFEAMQLLWKDKIIDCPPTRRLISALSRFRRMLVIGHGSASKTFTVTAFKLMKWYSNPSKTGLALTSATIKSLSSRAWADLLLLHRDAVIPMPGYPYQGIYEIRYDRMDKKNKILCVAGEDEGSVTKIQGFHPENLDLVIDEADNEYNIAIWKAIANLATSGEFTIVGMANPMDRNSIFGMNCEPVDGWGSIDINSSFEWESRTGYHVIRLDGLDSPNIKAGRTIYPFLLSNQGVADIIYEFGENSPNYLTYVRAWFPDQGAVNTIFTGELVHKMEHQEIVFYSDSVPVAACDPSLGGGNRCVVAIGRAGVLAHHPRKGCVVIDKFIYVQPKDPSLPITNDFGTQIKEICMEHGIKPEHFAIGSAVTDIGIRDFISTDWSADIVSIDPYGSPSRMRILQEDSLLADARFDRKITELWWAMREWAKSGQLKVREINRDLRIQLESRRWAQGKENKVCIEKKEDMKKRGLKSPDESDCTANLVALVRMKFGDLEATALDHDPALRKMREEPQKILNSREDFEPGYKTDQVLGGRQISERGELGGEFDEERYYSQDLD